MAEADKSHPHPRPRFAFSFGFKLMAAMLLMVAAISTITLIVAQNRVDAVYREFLTGQFADQADLFFEKRDARLSGARTSIGDALSNVRLVAALGAGDYDQFLSDLAFEVEEILQRYGTQSGPPGGGLASGPFFRFILASGEMLRAKDSRAGFIAGMDEDDLAQALTPLIQMSNPDMGDRVGYLKLGDMFQPMVYEILVVPLVDNNFSGDYLGGLIFGVPVRSMSEFAGGGGGKSSRKNALLIGDFLFSDHITGEVSGKLKSLLKMEINSPTFGPLELDISRVPHRVFARPLTEGSLFPKTFQVSLFSLGELRDLLDQLRTTIIGFTLLALVAAIVLSFIIAHQMTRPILALVRGTEDVSKGIYGQSLPVSSGDEIGILTRSFNDMSADLALKEQMRSVLDKVTDRRVDERLLSGEVDLGGELRDITVLFCDIRGFTPLTEGMPPAKVIAMLNEHMTAMTKIVHHHHGVVDKFVGDEIMVLFGAPESYGQDTLNAAQCALAMKEVRERLNAQGEFSFGIGIGMASGEMVAGNMGSDDRLNYTVLGIKVNLAARLCSAAGPMEVFIDEETGKRLRGTADMEPLYDLKLKGFRSAVNAFKLNHIPAGDA